jgi:DNA-binding LytR/AlgR family response regulator
MVRLVCSPPVRERLERELSGHGIDVTADGHWALVERGHAVPDDTVAIVFDALDHRDAVRLLVAGARDTTALRTVTGQAGSTYAVLAVRDVRVVEAGHDGAVARTARGRFRVRETIAHYETAWASLGFVRANRSQLVNLAHVVEIVPWFNSRYVLRLVGGDEVEVSRTYARHLRAALRI